MKKIIDVIAGARPNFMKIAALFSVKEDFPGLELRFIHTGQHYDETMSEIFLKELNLPQPTHHLGVGSATHAVQTAEIMKRYEEWIKKNPPHMCVVVGDVNSTIACALAASKCGVKIAHVEAGLRSLDRTMPEEINRILTDSISDFHFVTENAAIKNLKKEGHSSSVHLVGNVMVDTLLRMKTKAASLAVCSKLNVIQKKYFYMTLHRPANVDNPEILTKILEQILWTAEKMPVIFPVHPRTKKNIELCGFQGKLKNTSIMMIEPQGYIESLSLMLDARAVITDSGGIQEETTALGTPCLTLRENTERPITIEKGTNILIKNDWGLFRKSVNQIIKNKFKKSKAKVPYWDGKTGQRILSILNRSSR